MITGADPRQVRTAVVMKNGQRAATLTREDDAITFRYEGDYLGSSGPAVATTLPLTETPRITRGGAVPAYFANLLPEGRRLTALRHAVKTSADDELSLLLAVGSDPVGDVQVVAGDAPAGSQDGPPEPDQAEVADFATIDFDDLLAGAGIGDPAALAGVQDKVSGRMLTLPLSHGGRRHFLKFEVPEFPRVVDNEAYFLTLARRLRHPVTRARVVHDRVGRAGLLVTRFDREVGPSGQVRALAVEDAAQLLDIHPAQKYTVTSEAIATRIGAVCAARPVALRAVLQQLLFAWLTGNGDLHAKNISVLASGAEWRVAPIYDVPSTAAYGDSTAALPLAGRRANLSLRAFQEFADAVGLPARAATATIAEVLSATEPAIAEVENGPDWLETRARRDLLRVLRRRRRDLGG
ncbi:MAG TPA: HipA domain-containing protein [Candidatus Ruania gallistercoris]|uniref:HipA domain-containing protein n=1 Tax=Candidatus Ruania gallistercoris TaxID=2838746 RepID=A0A9D2J3L6_9MICO|nr:HipA domain-containing protein [Candidatus Ruania gallistercoris]